MPEPPEWKIYVDDDADVLRVLILGNVRIEDWFEVLDAIPETSGFHPALNSIVDARDARFDFSTTDVHRLVVRLESYLAVRVGVGFRTAFLVGSDVDFGISRMVQTLAHELPMEARVFRELQKAEAWVRSGTAGALE